MPPTPRRRRISKSASRAGIEGVASVMAAGSVHVSQAWGGAWAKVIVANSTDFRGVTAVVFPVCAETGLRLWDNASQPDVFPGDLAERPEHSSISTSASFHLRRGTRRQKRHRLGQLRWGRFRRPRLAGSGEIDHQLNGDGALGMVHWIFQRVHFAAMPLAALTVLFLSLIVCAACGQVAPAGPRSPAGIGEQTAVHPVEVWENALLRASDQ